MTENSTELAKRLVIGHKRDGRSRYDMQAKRELIEACLRPGVSVARMALQHGINANLLRTWITRYRRQGQAETEATGVANSAFVPVVAREGSRVSAPLTVSAELPNGIRLDLRGGEADVARMLALLGRLSCSGSTAG